MSDDTAPDGPAPGPGSDPASPAGETRPRPAFPFAKLAVSAVGIGVAVWFWLGSGWRWDVTPRDLAEGRPPAGLGSWAGRYVRLVGARASERPPVDVPAKGVVYVGYMGGDGEAVLVRRAPGGKERLSGRVVRTSFGEGPARMIVDATEGRVNSRAALAVVILLWGIAHAAANVYVWRRRSAASSGREAA